MSTKGKFLGDGAVMNHLLASSGAPAQQVPPKLGRRLGQPMKMMVRYKMHFDAYGEQLAGPPTLSPRRCVFLLKMTQDHCWILQGTNQYLGMTDKFPNSLTAVAA